MRVKAVLPASDGENFYKKLTIRVLESGAKTVNNGGRCVFREMLSM